MNDLGNPKILIVDDMETNIDILVTALREDYRVGMARNGQRGYRKRPTQPAGPDSLGCHDARDKRV